MSRHCTESHSHLPIASQNDPSPSIKIQDGRIIELDEKLRKNFDMLDQFIADYTIDVESAVQMMTVTKEEWNRA